MRRPITLNIPAPQRLAILKNIAANGKWARPMTWRDVRFANFKSHTGLSGGFNGEGKAREAVWTTHDGAFFSREWYADETPDAGYIGHTGHYTDIHSEGTARGIVALLPHGRWIAGYEWSDNGERVYFGGIHSTAKDAASMADEHARVFAENAIYHSERHSEAQEIQSKAELAETRIAELYALRNHAKFPKARSSLQQQINTLRMLREQLTDYSDVL